MRPPLKIQRVAFALVLVSIAGCSTTYELGKHSYAKRLALAFSPDGRLLASAGGDYDVVASDPVRLWDVKARRPMGPLVGPGNPNAPTPGYCEEVDDVAFSPDGKSLITVCREFNQAKELSTFTTHWWNIQTRKLTRTVKGRAIPSRSLEERSSVTSPDGSIVAYVDENGIIKLR